MKLEYLKYIKKYLSKTREYLGRADFSVSDPFNLTCIYGVDKGRILITDINSVYIINGCHGLMELMIMVNNRGASRLINTSDLIYDISKYPLSLNNLSALDAKNILDDEQRYFFEHLLQNNVQSFYDEKESVLLGISDDACGFLYVPTLKSTNCR